MGKRIEFIAYTSAGGRTYSRFNNQYIFYLGGRLQFYQEDDLPDSPSWDFYMYPIQDASPIPPVSDDNPTATVKYGAPFGMRVIDDPRTTKPNDARFAIFTNKYFGQVPFKTIERDWALPQYVDVIIVNRLSPPLPTYPTNILVGDLPIGANQWYGYIDRRYMRRSDSRIVDVWKILPIFSGWETEFSGANFPFTNPPVVQVSDSEGRPGELTTTAYEQPSSSVPQGWSPSLPMRSTTPSHLILRTGIETSTPTPWIPRIAEGADYIRDNPSIFQRYYWRPPESPNGAHLTNANWGVNAYTLNLYLTSATSEAWTDASRALPRTPNTAPVPSPNPGYQNPQRGAPWTRIVFRATSEQPPIEPYISTLDYQFFVRPTDIPTPTQDLDPTRPTYVAQAHDRLDRIAFRVYGNAQPETLRTLVWANPGVNMLDVPQGTVLETPPVVPYRYQN